MLENNDKKGIPTLQEAEVLLHQAGKLNPGPWVKHSMYASKVAKMIAQNCEDLDPHIVSILGMLHDIGRRFVITGMRHILKATFETKEYFELKMGKSVYSILPGVVENTFRL